MTSPEAIPEYDFAQGMPQPIDLAGVDALIVRQGLATERFFDIASRARQTCQRLFVTGDWQRDLPGINYDKRAAPPEAVDESCEGEAGQGAALAAVSQSPLVSWIEKSLGHPPKLKGGRLRFQPPDAINHAHHQDIYFMAGCFFTLWIPAVEPGVLCNRDAPGIEILPRGIPERLLCDPTDSTKIDPRALAAAVTPEDPERLFVRPVLALGDAVMFRECVPHGGHIPETATQARTSFDFRFSLD